MSGVIEVADEDDIERADRMWEKMTADATNFG